MYGVVLHRWALHSLVLDEKAMHAGIGAVLMVLAAQLLITLYLLKDQMKQGKPIKVALKQGRLIQKKLNNRYSPPSLLVFERKKNNHITLWDLRENEALFLESDGEYWVHFDWEYRKKRNKIPINSLDKAH